MNYAPGAGSIGRLVDQQSSALQLCLRTPPARESKVPVLYLWIKILHLKGKVYIYSLDIHVGSAVFAIISYRYCNPLFHSLISLGRM